MTARTIRIGSIMLFVAAAVCAAGCTGPGTPPPGGIAAPAETAVQVPTGEAGAFFEEGIVNEDRVVARYVPRNDEPTVYWVSYEVLTNGTTKERAEDRLYENVSPESPITIVVPRSPGETVTFDTVIRDTDGTVVWESRAVYGPLAIREIP